MFRGVADLNVSFLRSWSFLSMVSHHVLRPIVFAQLMEDLPLYTFRRYVRRYPSKYTTQTFSHLD